ncbi:ATP-dependent Clp protease proteolytic subunit [Nonomuraea guangzhouensis]|uniref:ATP-dependent Clp protease proteolytic subunit n=1 Tax=Nonomuraea guangzhouensis TaxID=1291555 RepID=A0ABW4GNZ2_9ACTN|nr:ATP-dependent Clp protease proteolytic subunit [Nonomuraea guangzhouensis]
MSGRYVLPSFTERTSYGMKEMNPYNKLFEDRVIFLGTPIDDTSANDVMAQLLTLESLDPDQDINMYINSPGGSFTAMTAIYDTMQFVRPEIHTVCIGEASSAAAVLLAAGTPGKRAALPHARVLLHEPATEGGRGQSSDMEIHAREILRMRGQQEFMLARHTGKTELEIRKDIERDRIFTAEQARSYNLIDDIYASRKRTLTTAR